MQKVLSLLLQKEDQWLVFDPVQLYPCLLGFATDLYFAFGQSVGRSWRP